MFNSLLLAISGSLYDNCSLVLCIYRFSLCQEHGSWAQLILSFPRSVSEVICVTGQIKFVVTSDWPSLKSTSW